MKAMPGKMTLNVVKRLALGGPTKQVRAALTRSEGPSPTPTREGVRGMTGNNIEIFRQALERERWKLACIRRHSEAIDVQRVADSIDGSTLENERHVALEACSRNAIRFAEVTEALDRISAGCYGLCLECGDAISLRRLSALPWARLCLDCQEEAEKTSRAGARDVTPGLIDAA